MVSRTAITAGENANQDATALAPGPDPDPGTGTTNTGSLATNSAEKVETTETTRTAAPPPRSPGSTRGVDTTEQVTWLLHIVSMSTMLSADSVELMTLWSGSSNVRFCFFCIDCQLKFPPNCQKKSIWLFFWVAPLPQTSSIYSLSQGSPAVTFSSNSLNGNQVGGGRPRESPAGWHHPPQGDTSEEHPYRKKHYFFFFFFRTSNLSKWPATI